MLEKAKPFPANLCPICGQANQCAMEIEKATGIAQDACWCLVQDFSADLLARVPFEAQNQACTCPSCAQSAVTEA